MADMPSISEAAAATQFQNLVQSSLKRYLKTQESNREQFLSQNVDLDYICDSLSSLGITKKTFLFPPSSPHNPPILITNRVVIDLEIYRKKQSLSKKICILWLSQLGALPESKISYAVDSVIKTHQNKLKNSHRDPDAVQAFLNGLFYLCSKDISKVPDKDSTSFYSNSTCAVIKPPKKCDKCQKLEEEKRSLYEVLECVQSEKKHLENNLDLCERENLRLKERENVLKESENVLKERVKNGQVGGKKVSTLQNNLRDSKSYCICLQNQL